MAENSLPAQQDELACLVRGACGALVFAVPVLYTMEVWWLAHSTPTWKIVLFFLLGYGLCVGLNLFSGFREADTLRDFLEDSVTSLGLGSLVAALMLWVMGVIAPSTPLLSVIKQVMILAVPTAIGFSLARSLLGGKGAPQSRLRGLQADLADFGMTIVGGVFLGLSVAPNEEVLAIAIQGSWIHGLAFAILSILVSYALIFMADLSGQSNRLAAKGILQSPWGETLMSYGLALLVALVLLWFMGYLVEGMSLHQVLGMMLVLGLPCTIGGAAGRLVV
jgi:putative integral membrane protein (TIGR02587 family)